MDNSLYYSVMPSKKRSFLTVQVPGSKSITNRVLLLSALSAGISHISNFPFSNDTVAMLSALRELGISIEVKKESSQITVTGCSDSIPCKEGTISVHSAGTAARFLTSLLAFSDGTYTITADDQMKKRPMEPLLYALSSLGVRFDFLEEEQKLPFQIHGCSSPHLSGALSVDIDKSTQFLSALMMTGARLEKGLTLIPQGSRSALSYVHMTSELMRIFGAPFFGQIEPELPFHVGDAVRYHATDFTIEPDFSGACYFFAAAALLSTTVFIPGLQPDSLQGDHQFLDVLRKLNCTVSILSDGISVTGPKDGHFKGIDICMTDFSDQAITMAVLALFADSETHIRNISHIRHQECDRIEGILTEIGKLGGTAKLDREKTGLVITPSNPLHGAVIDTYHDHRMAMGFALAGLRIPGVRISDPSCCRKTFENYFDLFTNCFC